MSTVFNNSSVVQEQVKSLGGAYTGAVRFEQSKTLLNMVDAYTKATQARCAYAMVAELAKAEGYNQVAAIAQSASDNKMVHAKVWYKGLKQLEDVRSAILLLADREHEAWSVLYPKYIADARAEGFDAVANKFERLIETVKHQETMWRTLISQIEMSSVLRGEDMIWKCTECGYTASGDVPPQKCMICDAVGKFVEYKKELLKYVAAK